MASKYGKKGKKKEPSDTRLSDGCDRKGKEGAACTFPPKASPRDAMRKKEKDNVIGFSPTRPKKEKERNDAYVHHQ